MADFAKPFADDGEKRYPETSEKAAGFPCGPADQDLFNGMFYRLEAELGELITYSGITPTDARFTQVRESIMALIDAAVGSGDTAQFVLMSQARSRIPIFPEVQRDDGLIAVTAPSIGIIRVPGNITFTHRGVFNVTTIETDFSTNSNKIYHIRWNPTDGYQMKDLSDLAYNPSSLDESNIAFDTLFDDMLIARVVTNSSNFSTITNLSNKSRLGYSEDRERSTLGVVSETSAYGGNSIVKRDIVFDLNWSRKPIVTEIRALVGATFPKPVGFGLHGAGNAVHNKSVDRYKVQFDAATDFYQESQGGYFEVGLDAIN